MKKISIIIPNYNGEKYIEKCLRSVLGQDYLNKEIIVVDDGSSDSSLRIIRKIAKNNNCMKVYNTKHTGPNMTRKLGLEKATGDFVMFVDSDDFLEEGAVRTLVEKVEHYGVDVVRFDAKYYPGGGKVLPVEGLDEKENVIGCDEIVSLLTTGYTLNSLWGKLYRKNLLKNTEAFDYDVDLGEDLLINMEVCGGLDKMLIIDEVFYNYRNDNPYSITHKNGRKRIIKNIKDRVFVSCEMLKFIDNNIADDKLKSRAIYEQLKAIWEVMKRLALIDGYGKDDFYADFEKCFSDLKMTDDNSERLNRYVRERKFLDKIKAGNVVLVIAENDVDDIWKNFLRYRRLKKLFRRGK